MTRSLALVAAAIGFLGALVSAQPPEIMPGWPRDFRADLGFTNPGAGLPIIDLDGDGDLELAFPSLDSIYIYHHDGTPFAGWPQATRDGLFVMHQLAIGDIDGDGEYDIVAQCDKPFTGKLFAWSLSGLLKPSFPIESGFVQQSPCLYDLDRDGADEIIMAHAHDQDTLIYVWCGDGSYYPGWPKYGYCSWWEPAVGDLDDDGSPDILFGCQACSLYAWSHGGHVLEGFPVPLCSNYAFFAYPPSLCDFNRNENLDITLIQWFGIHPNYSTRIHVLDNHGEHYWGWPREFDNPTRCTPTAGEFSPETDDLEVALGIKYSGEYYLLDSEGFVMHGWPQIAPWGGSTMDSPVIGDIDGDQELEVVFDCSSGDETDTGVVGYVWAFNADGSPVDHFPLRVMGTTAWSVPAIGDVDNDGILEMVVMSHYLVGTSRRYNRVAIYKLHTPYNPDLMIWPMSAHDPQRTNNATFRRTTWVDDFRSELKPERFELAQNYPNPFNSKTTITYSVKASYPVQVRLKVFNISGQEVRDLVDKVQRTGSYFAAWDGCNRRGEEVASGIYIYRLTVGDGSTSQRKMVLLR